MKLLMHTLKATIGWLEDHAAWLLIGGLLAAGAANWFQWRRDKRRVQEIATHQAPLFLSNETPRISVLLPAWNEASGIGPCIESILALRYPVIELVVCAGGDDQTLDVAQRYTAPNVVVLEQYPSEGKQKALQRCFERSSSQVIFLTDADCLLDDDCFEKVIEPVISDAEKVTTGSWKPIDAQLGNPFVIYQWIHNAYFEVVGGEYVASLIGRNAAIKRQALEQVAAFEPPAPIGTDLFLSNQLLSGGYRIRFIRDSRVRTRYSDTVTAYWRQISRWFRNPVLLGMKDETITIRGRLNNLRAGLVALFMLGAPIIGGTISSKTIGALWATIMWYLTLNQVRSTHLTQLRGVPRPRLFWQYMLFLLYMVVGWIGIARGFIESLLPWRRWKW
ncbi:MAG: glycosyltransferase family 2 protein [Chloroflexi bacterium]|nr:glycosyltransferase family 2 protein [Chloroflexota bacterium]